jgi:hypothetical protein
MIVLCRAAHAAVLALAVVQVTAVFASGVQVAHGGRKSVHAVLAEYGAYRIPGQAFVWYGNAASTDGADAAARREADPDNAASTDGADAAARREADPDVSLHVKVSVPYTPPPPPPPVGRFPRGPAQPRTATSLRRIGASGSLRGTPLGIPLPGHVHTACRRTRLRCTSTVATRHVALKQLYSTCVLESERIRRRSAFLLSISRRMLFLSLGGT